MSRTVALLERGLSSARVRLSTLRWRASLRSCGPGSLIGAGSRIATPAKTDVGSKVFVGARAIISCYGGLTIEDDVMIGPELNIQAGNHSLARDRRDVKADESRNPTLVIGKGAWLGSRVTLLAGADIGEYAVIAAGAVCTKPVAPWTMVGGVPARFIRAIPHDGSDQS